jgi:hypothetical protein
MQFREQGKRIQVLGYRGYDKAKRRAVVKLLGSFDLYEFTPSDGLVESLTDDEKLELQSHIENILQSRAKAVGRSHLRSLASHIKNVSDSLIEESSDGILTEQYACQIYEAVDSLTKKLRKLGYSRPVRQSDVK